ncbi:hypothetical protein FRC12_023234 [Ceratobasidium sp. 428]|nr:hypothetical protein FRC12_023234 [Ceratobasidium sp. 428]
MCAELAVIQACGEIAHAPLVIGDTRSNTPWCRNATGGFSASYPDSRQGLYVPPHLWESDPKLNTSIIVPSSTVNHLNNQLDYSTNTLGIVNHVVAAVNDMRARVHSTNKCLEGKMNTLIQALTMVVLTQLGQNATAQTPAEASPPKAPTEVSSPSLDSVEVLGTHSTHLSMPAL